MSARTKLKRALSAIDDAQRALKKTRNNSEVDDGNIKKAIRELEDAESDIKRAMRDIDQ